MGLSDHLRATLSGAPDLLLSPALATAVAQGASLGMHPRDTLAVAQSAAIAEYARGIQDFYDQVAANGV